MSNWMHVLIAIAAVVAFFSLLSMGASKSVAHHEARMVRAAKQAKRLAPPPEAVTPLLDRASPGATETIRPVKLE